MSKPQRPKSDKSQRITRGQPVPSSGSMRVRKSKNDPQIELDEIEATIDANAGRRNFGTVMPDVIDDKIIEFCKSLAPDSIPDFVEICPEHDCIERKCYTNVGNKVKSDGGIKQCGWMIIKFSNAFLCAFAHAIWVSDDDFPVDITPDERFDFILFLPSDSVALHEYSYENKHMALVPSPYIEEFAHLHDLFCQDLTPNTGNQAYDLAVIRERYRIKQLQHLFNLVVEPNDPCPCKSELEYKNCCGSRVA